ncbi:MAG: FAD-binding oxidoreductase [Sphingomonadales bacterium]|nr:FAD-binding oxidoreductase [Sphingomonadales bacterium]
MSFDIAIIGAGMAGASLAAELAGRASVVLLEGESQPGYHATGRSAAFWSESYGGPAVQPLTTASHAFLAEGGFIAPRGALHIADDDGLGELDAFQAAFEGSSVELNRLDAAALAVRVHGLKPRWRAAVEEPSCADIDVAGLHQAYLKAAKQAGADVYCGARIERIERDGGRWRLGWADDRVEASLLVNAAGAWADEIAALAGLAPIGIRPLRRTMIQLATIPPAPPDMPLVVEARGRFYFKGEAGGKLWLSPHDETPEPPGDTAPVELDVAALERKWAGQRSFVADRLPVYGFDPADAAFFWCAGQGGFGIQTAPAAARLCASLLLGKPGSVPGTAIDPNTYSPARLRR